MRVHFNPALLIAWLASRMWLAKPLICGRMAVQIYSDMIMLISLYILIHSCRSHDKESTVSSVIIYFSPFQGVTQAGFPMPQLFQKIILNSSHRTQLNYPLNFPLKVHQIDEFYIVW